MDNRKKIQDMTPTARRSIRNVSKADRPAPVSRPAPRVSRIEQEEVEERRDDRRERPAPAPRRKSGKGGGFSRTLLVLLILIVSLGIVAVALSLLFSSGSIIVKPKVMTVTLDKTPLTAVEKPVGAELGYQTLALSEMATTSVPAVQGVAISKKATGTIILYNNISTQPQKIFINTRLSNAKGLIYLTTATVIIPGQKVVGGKIIPGSVKVGITASAPGSQYNTSLIDLTGDFKVVAYLGGPKYTKVYGRLSTDLTGGYAGKVVTPDAKAVAIETDVLKQLTKARLLAESKGLVPKDYISYDSAYQIRYDIIPPVAEGTDRAVIGVKALYTGYIFKQDALVRAFARDTLAQFPADGSRFSGLETLSFTPSFPTSISTASSSVSGKISFTLSGLVKITGIIPVDAFIKDMTGVRLEDSARIIKKYNTITSAYAKIFPMWMRSLPDDSRRIKVEIAPESQE